MVIRVPRKRDVLAPPFVVGLRLGFSVRVDSNSVLTALGGDRVWGQHSFVVEVRFNFHEIFGDLRDHVARREVQLLRRPVGLVAFFFKMGLLKPL